MTPPRLWLAVLLLLLVGCGSRTANAQLLADTEFTWQGYSRTGRCHVRIYRAPAGEDRTHTIVVRELADNPGPSTVDDARHLVELIGRQFDLDPARALWVFHWGRFSYEEATENGKEIFLRATFRRTSTHNLSTPFWKVVAREEVEEYTDRLFR